MVNYKDIEDAKKLLSRHLKNFEREYVKFVSSYDLNEDFTPHLSEMVSVADRLSITTRLTQAAQITDEKCPSDMDLIRNISLPEECKLVKTTKGYEVFLPSLNGKKFALGRKRGDGKTIKYILQSLLMRNEDLIDVVEDPAIIFEHHIDTSDNLGRYMDSDNLDIKVVTDTLQGQLIGDDNALALTVMHIGLPDDKSFCKLHIIPKNSLPEWAVTHINLFKNSARF